MAKSTGALNWEQALGSSLESSLFLWVTLSISVFVDSYQYGNTHDPLLGSNHSHPAPHDHPVQDVALRPLWASGSAVFVKQRSRLRNRRKWNHGYHDTE